MQNAGEFDRAAGIQVRRIIEKGIRDAECCVTVKINELHSGKRPDKRLHVGVEGAVHGEPDRGVKIFPVHLADRRSVENKPGWHFAHFFHDPPDLNPTDTVNVRLPIPRAPGNRVIRTDGAVPSYVFNAEKPPRRIKGASVTATASRTCIPGNFRLLSVNTDVHVPQSSQGTVVQPDPVRKRHFDKGRCRLISQLQRAVIGLEWRHAYDNKVFSVVEYFGEFPENRTTHGKVAGLDPEIDTW